MQDLALQVREVDGVVVDHAQRADPGGGQIEQQRRAEPAGADHQHSGIEQFGLPLLADLRQDQVAGIAVDLCVGEVSIHGTRLRQMAGR